MHTPPLPSDDQKRVEALRAYRVLDTPAEREYDDLVRLAAQICGTPIALVSFVDAERQWFKARLGLEVTETHRDFSFCAHAIEAPDEFLVVPDAAADERFHDNPLVTGEPHIRFYAGAPMKTPDGYPLGTLCVIDRASRTLDARQQEALGTLANLAVSQLELRRAREAAAESEARLKQILDAVPIAVSVMNPDGRMSFRNLKALEIIGQPLGAAPDLPNLGTSLQAYVAGTDEIYPTDRMAIVLAIRGIKSTSEDVELLRHGRRMVLRTSGSPVYNQDGTVACGVVAFEDISARIASEKALRASEARFRSLIDRMRNGLLTVDENSIIESINRAGCGLFGYSAEELIGQSLGVLLPPALAARGPEGLREARRIALDRITEWEGRRKNGEIFPFELSHFAFDDVDGRPHYAGIVRDISERREIERMKQAFVSTISHELRTPLTSIRGSLGLLASGAVGELPEDAANLVQLAERNTERLIALINDILDLDRLESGRMEMSFGETSIADVIVRSIDAIGAFAEQHRVRIDVDASEGVAWGDRDRLVQVLVNLISNAVKFSPSGGAVRIAAHADGRSVEVRVADRGRGIPGSHHRLIFERFRQVESSDARQKGGTGLGLAICKSIVEQHGGTIGVESETGKGSTFWFRVPVWLGSRDAWALDAEGRVRGYVHNPIGDVLVVEDDAELLEVLTRQLASHGIAVRAATSGREAITLVEEAQPRLIILDVTLPSLDGYAVVARLRAHPALKQLALLVYTAADLSEEQRRRLQLGPTRFLTKLQVTSEELLSTVNELLQ